MSDPSPARPSATMLADLLDALPDGVVALDRQWQVLYANRAGAALLQRPVSELVGRNLWTALPELTGTMLHGLLLHARGADEPVTWTGFYPPARRWVTVTAGAADGVLQVSLRTAADPTADDGTPSRPGPETRPELDSDRLRYLAEVSESLITTLDTDETATRLAELAASRLCDWAIVALADEAGGHGEQAWAHHDAARRADLDTYMTGRLPDTGDDAALVGALLTGQPVRVPVVHQELIEPSLGTEAVRQAWRRLDATSCTIVPLRARDTTFGALALVNSGGRPPHTDEQIATAVEVARRGALSLDNARLFGRQQTVAEKLQRSLLTDPPQPDDLELVVRYRPATTHMHVGGDWYDAFQADGALLAVIGDVVGHDLDAAAAMGQIRSILRGVAFDRADAPARVLTRVDSVLTGLEVGTMATALVGRIEQTPAQQREGMRVLRWSSAGHLPPLLLQPDGSVDVLATRPERLLGTDHPGPRGDHQAPLHPGSTVILYTDGLVEQGHTGVDEGIARLADVLTGLSSVPLDELCDQLLDRMLPCRADDDVALLAVRCHPQRADE